MPILSHHFLIPTAQMSDPRFFEALIYICRHSDDGAWGFIVNRPSKAVTVGGLLGEMGIDGGQTAMSLPAMEGGVVRPEAGFILHTGLPKFYSSFAVSENICLTTSKDILSHLAPVSQFTHYLLLMGFCGWHKGQLEAEIENGDWLTCPASSDILFHANHAQKLDKAYQALGVNPDLLAPTMGRA